MIGGFTTFSTFMWAGAASDSSAAGGGDPVPSTAGMYLQAATCQDLTTTDVGRAFAMPHPAGGTIWEKLDEFGISWLDYAWDLPDIALFPSRWRARLDRVRTFPASWRTVWRARCPTSPS